MLLKLIVDHKGELDNFLQLLQKIYSETGRADYIFCSEDGSRLVVTQDMAVDLANYAEEYDCEIKDALNPTVDDIRLAEMEMDDPDRVYRFITDSFYEGDLEGNLNYIFEQLGFAFDSWEETTLNASEIFEICLESLKTG